MNDDSIAAKKRIDEALEALLLGLTPFVSERMTSIFGHNWRVRASCAFNDEEKWALDVYALLKTILDNWRNGFSADAKLRKARPYISVALDARNNVAHFTGLIGQREALRYLDAILELLRAVGANAQEALVSKLYAQQQAGALSTAPTPVHIPAAIPVVTGSSRSPTSHTDRIRQFALEQYVHPALLDGRGQITIKAGDVHRQMGLTNALPAVCNALGGKRFAEIANVSLVNRTGPPNGSNVFFEFTIDVEPAVRQVTAGTQDPVTKAISPAKTHPLNLDGALVLVSCVKSKLSHAAPARSLYTSTWFTGVREIVEASLARWFVLSSRYGLVAPNEVIAPYDYTLSTLGVAERRAWAQRVLDKLLPKTTGCRRINMFASHRYREFLLEPLRQRGIVVDVPMENLVRGEQLAWLNHHR
jgi:hypothetical protein